MNGLWTMIAWINGIYDRDDIGVPNLSSRRSPCWGVVAELMKYDYSHLPEVSWQLCNSLLNINIV